MSTTAQTISAYVLEDLVRKLSPARFPGIPQTLAAFTAFILGARFCRPYITPVVVTDSGIVHAWADGDTDTGRILGSCAAVLRNRMHLISRAGLSPRKFMEIQSLFAAKVGFLGPTNA